MTSAIVAPVSAAAEAYDIHLAACRYRRQGLACSACSDLAEHASRAAVAAQDGPAAVPAPRPLVTAAMRVKAALLADLIPMMHKGRSKVTGAEFVIFPGSRKGTAWWANFIGCNCPGFDRRGVCTHQMACDLLGEREEAARIVKRAA